MHPRTKYLTVPAAWGGRPCATRVQYPEVLDGPLAGFNFGKDGCATAWFWTIVRELENDEGMAWMQKHGTWYEFLLQAWRDNRILGLRMQDTDNLVRVRHQRQRSPTPNETRVTPGTTYIYTLSPGDINVCSRTSNNKSGS